MHHSKLVTGSYCQRSRVPLVCEYRYQLTEADDEPPAAGIVGSFTAIEDPASLHCRRLVYRAVTPGLTGSRRRPSTGVAPPVAVHIAGSMTSLSNVSASVDSEYGAVPERAGMTACEIRSRALRRTCGANGELGLPGVNAPSR